MTRRTAIALAMTLAVATAGPALADEGDTAKGEKYFNQRCKMCHLVGEDAKNRPTGPLLNDIIGVKAGSRDGFKYSKAMKEAGAEKGIVWDDETLNGYLEKPKKFIPKNRMGFGGIKDEETRKGVIAYLKKFSGGQ